MKAVFNFKGLVHLVMIAFAVASLGNVHAFLSSAGHPSEVAWALGIALGSALVIVAMMITHVDREVDPDAFWWLVATGIGLGLISGALQAAELRRDGAPTLEMANEQRAINTQAKKSAILDVLMNEGPQGISAIAAAIGVHRDTARRYLNELLDLGQVENVNRKWRLVKLTVPEPEQIVLNGSGVSG